MHAAQDKSGEKSQAKSEGKSKGNAGGKCIIYICIGHTHCRRRSQVVAYANAGKCRKTWKFRGRQQWSAMEILIRMQATKNTFHTHQHQHTRRHTAGYSANGAGLIVSATHTDSPSEKFERRVE